MVSTLVKCNFATVFFGEKLNKLKMEYKSFRKLIVLFFIVNDILVKFNINKIKHILKINHTVSRRKNIFLLYLNHFLD